MNGEDLSMKEEVLKKLLGNGEVDAHNFDIEVENGVVKLEGDVTGRHAKKVIDKCLEELDGIRHVENKLKIRRVARFSDNSMHGF
jgi:osmotically-inducible protein OsmY